jgi:crossover junction endodeoxyribonuclease RuvC
METRFVTMGFDTSTWTGIAKSDGEGDYMGKSIHVELKGWARVQSIADSARRTLLAWKPDLGIIEDYALGMKKSPAGIVTQVEIGTMIRSLLYENGVPWIEVRPSTLKKWTTGDGHADKVKMAVFVKKLWGFESPSDDVIDAFALAQLGQHLAHVGLKTLPNGVKHGFGNF